MFRVFLTDPAQAGFERAFDQQAQLRAHCIPRSSILDLDLPSHDW
jgi:hypothetical protein